MDVNASFYGIPHNVAADMEAAEKAAAKSLCKYPNPLWQLQFQGRWLWEKGYHDAADKAAMLERMARRN